MANAMVSSFKANEIHSQLLTKKNLLAFAAITKNLDHDFLRPKAIFFADLSFNFPQLLFFKFHNFSAFQANEVVMLLLSMDRFIVMVFLPMDYLFDETCLDQEGEGAINRGFGDTASLFPKTICEFFWLKMVSCGNSF